MKQSWFVGLGGMMLTACIPTENEVREPLNIVLINLDDAGKVIFPLRGQLGIKLLI